MEVQHDVVHDHASSRRGRRGAEGYGLVVFAAILLLVVNYLNPAGTTCS
jgi:hypothetical protein